MSSWRDGPNELRRVRSRRIPRGVMSTNGERDGVNTSRLLAKRLRGWLAPGMSRRDGAIGGCRGGGPVKCAHLGPKHPPSDAILGRMSDSITADVDGTEVKINHPAMVLDRKRTRLNS